MSFLYYTTFIILTIDFGFRMFLLCIHKQSFNIQYPEIPVQYPTLYPVALKKIIPDMNPGLARLMRVLLFYEEQLR
ncbi:MAG: hypothetical protein DI535_08980 [Citrobacter freundii]|nr:MAG: hypothetical protein DI535_08980 [Citrobacter freundii]